MKRQSQRGVALVITLIMLSVITLLAVAFLAISRRNKESVGTSLTQVDAKAMNDAALARAEAELVSRMLSTMIPAPGTNIQTTNLLNFDLLVSTNYINPAGYDPNPAKGEDPSNVNFDKRTDGNPFTADDWKANIGNLSRDPRVPVYVVTNSAYPENYDFRFYLDLNRNGVFDTNGQQVVIRNGGFYDTNGVEIPNIIPSNTLSNIFVGDPEWIGILERPDVPHSGTNRFIGRYCYVVLPIGKTLDLNAIHNQAKLAKTGFDKDGFLRNQGYGSWELNLAAFLADLNTNYWNTNFSPYFYNTNFPFVSSSGYAFDDARELLRYRYSPNAKSSTGNANTYLKSAQSYYTTSPADFGSDSIDNYSDGPLVVSNSFVETALNQDQINLPWSGSDNTNRFYSLFDELFDTNKIVPTTDAVGFVGRLKAAAAQTNSYDRYTFYRLLSQMGTESVPENANKLNINYKDQANFVRWTNNPVEFFTNAAMRLLAAHYGRPVTNIHIQVYSSNTNAVTNYAPEIHRLLQLAANIYDATTTNGYPSVFRPLFTTDNSGGITNVYITDYMEQNSQPVPTNFWSLVPKTAGDPTLASTDIVRGIPFIVGAKKGLPNLNEVSLQTLVGVTRRLEIRKPSPGAVLSSANASQWQTNQQYILNIQNYLGIEAWNSYTNPYPRPLTMMLADDLIMDLTNQFGEAVFVTNTPSGGFSGGKYWITNPPIALTTNITPTWPKMTFMLPVSVAVTNLKRSKYVAQGNFFQEASGPQGAMEPNNNNGFYFYVPEWGISFTNRLRYMLVDNGKIIDFVNLNDMIVTNNLSQDLAKASVGGTPANALWDPRHMDGTSNNKNNPSPTWGVYQQIDYSYRGGLSASDWASYGNGLSVDCEQKKLKVFFNPAFYSNGDCGAAANAATNVVVQVGFTPSWYLAYSNSWQANDPLIHYTTSDLKYYSGFETLKGPQFSSYNFTNQSNLGKINDAYSPWGGADGLGGANDAYDYRLKDALVTQSSDWDFPTNMFPSIGWIGRVHRGTPWQTVYLKSDVVPTNDWNTWSGHTNLYPGPIPVSFFTHPTNDWKLIDIFTVAPNDNAGRGCLSVNQTNLAAWSAALSGVIVLSNATTDAALDAGRAASFVPVDIQPSSPQLQSIWSAIVATNRAVNGFAHLGDLLSVPQLTTLSPFLTNDVAPQSLATQRKKGISDAAYERIPQQILSLLKLGEPRFVLYCWGQSLKPAENSIVFDAPSGRPELQNLCTNYQITGEVATRAVVRIDERSDGTNKNYQAVIESYNILPGN